MIINYYYYHDSSEPLPGHARQIQQEERKPGLRISCPIIHSADERGQRTEEGLRDCLGS
jgi:hypothetical protein